MTGFTTKTTDDQSGKNEYFATPSLIPDPPVNTSYKQEFKFGRILANIFFYAIFPIASIYYFINQRNSERENYRQEQQITCPSLLSIARSSRDTLIIMRDKEMCTEYTLRNLK